MSMQYIRTEYSVPAKRGMRVKALGRDGVIAGARGSHLRIRLDGQRHSCSYHPYFEIAYYDYHSLKAKHDDSFS